MTSCLEYMTSTVIIEDETGCYNSKNFGFGCLPLEIIVKIMDYLPFKDIKAATLTCAQWREAINHPKIQKRFFLQLSLTKQLISNHNLYYVFKNSFTKYSELHIETYHSHLELTDIYPLFKNRAKIFENVKYLTLQKTRLTFDTLCCLLSKSVKLTNLTVNACDIDNSDITNMELCENVMKNLKVLIMTTSVIGNSEKLLSILNMTSNLIEFDVYCTSFGGFLATSTQMVKLLINIIRRNAKTLKKIYLKTFEYGEPFTSITDVKDLKLESLSVVFSHQSIPYVHGFQTFLCQQKSLKFLDICTLSDFHLYLQPENLENLEHLKIFACSDNFENFNVYTLSKFKKLKILEIKGHISMRQYTIEPRINYSLTELILEMSDVISNDIIAISKSFRNLEILKLCSTDINDMAVQSIIKYLKKLKILKLDSFQGTDFGLTGINCETGKEEGLSIWNLTELESLRIYYLGVLDRDLVKLHFRFKKLKELCFENSTMNESYSLTADFLWQIIKNCPLLVSMRFSFNEEATQQCVKELSDMLKPHMKKITTCHFKNCINIVDLIL